MNRPLALTLLLACPLAAIAAQHIEGDALQVWYQDNGTWNDTGAGAGVQVLLDGEWVEFNYRGTAYQRFSLAFTLDGAEYIVYADSAGEGTNLSLVAETDASTTTERSSVYEYQVGDLEIVKTETWETSGAVMRVHFEVRNNGRDDVTGVELLYEFDPDQESDGEGGTFLVADCPSVFETMNDVQDINTDGSNDWVQSEGECSGYTVGILPCDIASAELGHYAEWGSEVGSRVALTDDDGGIADDAMAIRHTESRTLVAGGTIVTSFLVSFDETAAGALANAQRLNAWCETCDTDGDGVDNPVCGGRDCDDLEAGTYPGADDAWYDGVDSDCGGEDDYDQDADGYGSADFGGDDCDDENPEVNPGEMESWYDGIDQDCDGNDDDQDTDGYGQDEDCDDLDPDVWDDCGGEDDGEDGGDDGGGEDGGDGGDDGFPDTDDGEDEEDEEDESEGKSGCAHVAPTSSLAAGLLALLGLLGLRRRR